nr:type I restriction-modification system subunit M N-terminal domain-containing protein [Escherichia coli]
MNKTKGCLIANFATVPFKHTDFGKIILPFTLLRRLECALESTREASLDSQPATIEFLEAEFSVDFDALLS